MVFWMVSGGERVTAVKNWNNRLESHGSNLLFTGDYESHGSEELSRGPQMRAAIADPFPRLSIQHPVRNITLGKL